MQACGIACLGLGTNAGVLLLGSVLFGLGIGNLVSLPPLIAQREFAAPDVPRVVALVTAVNQAVFAFAPAIFGLLREASDGYVVPFTIAATMQVIAGLIIFLGRAHSSRVALPYGLQTVAPSDRGNQRDLADRPPGDDAAQVS